MAHYIEFPTEEAGVTILVEVDEEEVAPPRGVEKAGLLPARKDVRETVAAARVSFDVAVKRIVQENVRALTSAVGELETPPDEIELAFGLKATGEVGNLAIGKVGGEANFQLKLSWKSGDRAAGRPGAGPSDGRTDG